MKKGSYILLILFLIIGFTLIILGIKISFNRPKQEKYVEEPQIENKRLYYAMPDKNIYLYDLDNITISKDNNQKELENLLKQNEAYYNEFMNNFTIYRVLKDGGTKMYELNEDNNILIDDENKEVYVYECQTLNGIWDIYIGSDKLLDTEVCQTEGVIGYVLEIKNNETVINLETPIIGNRTLKISNNNYRIGAKLLISYEIIENSIEIIKISNYDLETLMDNEITNSFFDKLKIEVGPKKEYVPYKIILDNENLDIESLKNYYVKVNKYSPWNYNIKKDGLINIEIANDLIIKDLRNSLNDESLKYIKKDNYIEFLSLGYGYYILELETEYNDDNIELKIIF